MKHSLVIEAGAAFGSGAHPSTALALALLAALPADPPPHAILDMGCGSGVLALAVAKLYPARVVAADISAEAIAATEKNAHKNGVAERITAVRSDGFSASAIRDAAPYDLIVCNVLAAPAVAWARDVASCLAPSGRVILSGILAWQVPGVREAYAAAGLDCIHETLEDSWCALLLSKT